MSAVQCCVVVALVLFVDAEALTQPSVTRLRRSSLLESNTSRAASATRTHDTALHVLAADDSHLDRYQPCQCMAHSPSWQPPLRTASKCVFIDLGAGDGSGLKSFLGGGYGSMSACPGGDWEAYLVEANPLFTPALAHLEKTYQGKVHSRSSAAAYSCEANATFYVDVENRATNYGSSSMSKVPLRVKKSVPQETVVPTVNLMRLLYEETLPSDRVIVKMDIGGSEWDVVPCLSRSMDAKLIDRLFLNQHSQTWQLGHTTAVQMKRAKAALKSIGVDMPQ